VLVTAILAWWIASDPSSLAARGFLEGDTDVVVTAHRLIGRECFTRDLALWADKSVKQLLGIFFVNVDAGAVVPIITTTFTIDHHTVIIRATAEAVFTTIITFIARRCAASRTWSMTGLARA
jgi:hypothetical protein